MTWIVSRTERARHPALLSRVTLGLAAATLMFLMLADASAQANVLEGETGFCTVAAGGEYSNNTCSQPSAPGQGGWNWTPAAGKTILGRKTANSAILSDDVAEEVICKDSGLGAGAVMSFSGATGFSADLGFSRCLYGESGCGEEASFRHGGTIHAELDGELEESRSHQVRFVIPEFVLGFTCVTEGSFFVHADPTTIALGEANTRFGPTLFEKHLHFTAHAHETEGASEVTLEPATEYSGNEFEFRTHPPAVTGLTPEAGSPAGSTSVTLHGIDFEEVSRVEFGATTVPFTVDSPTEITVASPPGSGQSYVTVTNPAGTSGDFAANQFSYGPLVHKITPSEGPAAGGTTVTIAGEDLDEATGVKFGTMPAASYEIVSPEEIRAVAPAGVGGGAVEITISSATGSSAKVPGDFYFYAARPAVSKVSPNKGPATGGTVVTITGTELQSVSQVMFGGVPATSFTSHGYASIIAVAPPNAGGSADITVIAVGGTSPIVKKDVFKYAKPEITSVSPASGPLAGGTVVTVEGVGFATGAGTTILFGKAPGTGVSCESSTVCTVTSPKGVKAAAVDLIAEVGKDKSKKSALEAFHYE
jgi:IPT/TIG domain